MKEKYAGRKDALSSRASTKRRKITIDKSKNLQDGRVEANKKVKGKERAFQRAFIAIPQVENTSNDELSEEELEFFSEHAVAANNFLNNLDEKGISRSKIEQERLHRLTKPRPKVTVKDDLPSIDSHSEDESSWSSDIDEISIASVSADDDESGSSSLGRGRIPHKDQENQEMPYELLPRKRRKSWSSDEDEGIERLPVKLQDGKVQRTGIKVATRATEVAEDESSMEENTPLSDGPVIEDVSTGARFGKPAVVDVISKSSRRARIQAAKEQIASICQEIMADPENSLGLLRRLHTFCLPKISTPTHPEPVLNDLLIRKLAILSQVAVFKDIIPGYRIRPLTDKEKAEKVSQIVQRTRDFEQGLVSIYQAYLRVLESELKAKSELSDTCLQCICQLLVNVTHFNFQKNLMTAVVARLSRKSWDESSDLCFKTLGSVLRADLTGQPSLEIVRLVNRMIKECHYNVHPNVMFCLLDLRLASELGGVRASQSKVDKDVQPNFLPKGKTSIRKENGHAAKKPHLSKKAKKNLKESQAIEAEMREAEAEVDREERKNTQTETLKLLFVLYFQILKNEKITPLLPAALQGISRFSHLISVDFFKDLLDVLRNLASRFSNNAKLVDGDGDSNGNGSVDELARNMHYCLQCIATAFELLSGQGEALNIDLTDFVNHLYALIIPFSTMSGIESPAAGIRYSRGQKGKNFTGHSPADMLFRTLNLIFTSRTSSKHPAWRTGAFAKRLLSAALHFPPTTTKRTLVFVKSLLSKDAKLEALLSTEDTIANGIYRPDVDDPQLSNPFAATLWELQILSNTYLDQDVRKLAQELIHYSRE